MTGKIIQFPSLDDSEAAERALELSNCRASLHQWMAGEVRRGVSPNAVAEALKDENNYQQTELSHEGEIE